MRRPSTDISEQTVCGMSVVGKEWESLKRFNLHEIYQPSAKTGPKEKDEIKPQIITTDTSEQIEAKTRITSET